MPDIDMPDAIAPISPSEQLKKEASKATVDQTDSPTPLVNVTKPIPYTFDLGHLLVSDSNPVPVNPSDRDILALGRDCAQALINQLLTVCAIQSADDGVYITLPTPTTSLPREKSIPKEKEPTKWERFAAKKGIQAKKRDGKLVYDEASGEWVPKYGYLSNSNAKENEWLAEVDVRKEARTGKAGDGRKEKREERKERVRRQERRQRANERNGASKGD